MQLKKQSSLTSMTPDTCIIIGVLADDEFTPSGKNLNPESQKALKQLIAQGNLRKEPGETLFLPQISGISSKILLVYTGNKVNLTPALFRRILLKTAKAITFISASIFYCGLTALPIEGRDTHWTLFQSATIFASQYYRFTRYKSKQPVTPTNLPEFLIFEAPDEARSDAPLAQAHALVNGVTLIKDLAHTPPNICTPAYLAEEAIALSKRYSSISVNILEEIDMQNLGMHTLLSVSKGSKEPAKFICFDYKNPDNIESAPIVFIGKGVTFDTGGISLKPPANMDEMKFDMCGGATVFGLIQMAAELQLPLHLIGLIPTVENMPDGQASRPGDIVKSLSGQTIEILNTDAEGRLILCDALTYAERFKPELVIDLATLTGGAIMTFDHVASVIMGNDEPLIQALLDAATISGDKAWQLPLWEEYQEMLVSNFADIPNITPHNNAKTIIGGCFLSRFAQNFRWAHMDIAGSASIGGKDKGATGRPLPLLLQFLLRKVEEAL